MDPIVSALVASSGEGVEARVEAALFRLIAVGRLKPGQRIRQEELAAAANASRGPVKQVLARLDAEGLVRTVRNQGAQLVDLTATELQQIHRVRSLLEGEALSLVAANVHPEGVTIVKKHLDTMDSAVMDGDFLTAIDANTLFHFAIYEMSGSRFLTQLIRKAWLTTMPYRATYLSDPARWHRIQGEHRRIYDALAGGNAVALFDESEKHRSQFVTDLMPWLQRGDARSGAREAR